MRYVPVVAVLLVLAGCSSSASDKARLTLNNPSWDRVNVQLVITGSSDCDNRAAYIENRELVMVKNRLEVIWVPNGANVCWRRDRDPENPSAGAWSGWTKATLLPGGEAKADL